MGECTAGRHAGKKVAIKVQPRHKKTIYQITTENHALSVLGRTGARHLQQALAYGSHNDSCYVLVTELLGSNLLSLLPASGGVPARTTLLVAQQALEVLAGVHANGFVHRDIKPENLVLGNGAAESQVHLIDFGTAEALLDRTGARRVAPQRMEGTLPYMATTVHQKQPLSKRDDLESLAWTLVKLHLGALPWEALDMKKEKDVLKQKEACKKNVAALGEMSPFMRMFFDGYHPLYTRTRLTTSHERECMHLSLNLSVEVCDAELLDAIWALRTEDDVDYPALLSLVKDAWRAGTPKKDFGAFPAAGKARLVV
jgi:serine/threonine protein kinase